jgi:thiol-disulfide isomerase/thioredoxin
MIAAGIVVVLYVLFSAASNPEPAGGYGDYARGGMAKLIVLADPPPMPSQTLRDAAGAETDLPTLAAGRVTLVNYWATWCAPCLEEMPTLGQLARDMPELNVVGITVDGLAKEAEAEAQLARLTQGALDFYIEPSRGILFASQAGGMPVTILYGRDGRERARLVGGADWASEEAKALIEAALREP